MRSHEKILNAIVCRLNACSTQESLLNICEYVVECLDADGCVFFEFEDATGELLASCVAGKKVKITAREFITNGMSGWVAANAEMLVLDDGSNDARYKEEIANLGLAGGSPRGSPTRVDHNYAIIALPVMSAGHLSGVLEIIADSRRKYNTAEFEELQPFFNLMAMVMVKENNALTKLAEVCIRFLEERDRYTHGHSLRVANYCKVIADELNLSEAQKRELHLAAILHDIGKVTLKDNLLCNENQLTKLELQIVKMHPIIGHNILGGINKSIARIIRSHHEHYNGCGYPDGVKGEDIHLISRILCLADAIDAMISDRPYRQGIPIDNVMKELKDQAGRQFDPKLVDIFLEAYRKGKVHI
jgi:HD superfamily phosphohydrolase YqeK